MWQRLRGATLAQRCRKTAMARVNSTRCSVRLKTSQLPPPSPPPPASSRQHRLHRVCDAIYRSCVAREALRQTIHEPSHENALRLLGEFEKDPGLWRDKNWAGAFDSDGLPLTRQIDLVLARFEQWHTVRKAPSKVAMHNPWEWYPQARLLRRRFIFHYGPTNSGKTHAALEALVQARSGVYCAPLKALAAQVWHRVNRSVPCDLLIGDERVFGGAAEHVSCTVEMTPVDLPVDVAVIDEVQMMGDRERGWAWTRALLGLPAREIHLCGEERALPLIQEILYATHERKNLSFVAHRRLVPLIVSPSLNSNIQADTVENGDVFVCFSKRQVLSLQRQLNSLSGVTSSAIYGAMPFQVREAEAALFNRGVVDHIRSVAGSSQAGAADTSIATSALPSHAPHRASNRTPTTKHVLVSTDAIAYGLNMNIERIIFTTLQKFDGHGVVGLPASTIQQIAGRSGRFGLTRRHSVGRCTSLHERDMSVLRAAISQPLKPLEKAGLLPTADILQLFVDLEAVKARRAGVATPSEVSGARFFELMTAFAASWVESRHFFPCAIQRSLLRIAKLLEPVPGLSLTDRILFCYLPLSDSSPESLRLIVAYATDHAAGRCVELRFDVPCAALLKQVEQDNAVDRERHRVVDLTARLEHFFRQAEMYCWLSWRFGKTFVEREKGLELKHKIAATLVQRSSFS